MTKKEIKLNLGVEEIVNLNNEGVLEEKTCFEALKKFDKEDLIEALLGNETLDNEEDLEDEEDFDEDLDNDEQEEDMEDSDDEEDNEEVIDIEEVEEKPIKKESNNKEIDLDDDELANILD